MKRFLFLIPVMLVASFVAIGCSGSSEPEVDKNVPMGGANDPFKPTSVKGAGGGNAPKSGGLGTPSSQ